MTRLKRALAAVALALAASAGVAVLPSPVFAADVRCDSQVIWYHNRYEVVATHDVWCNTTAPLIVPNLAFTVPIWAEASNACLGVNQCTATVFLSNPSGTQRFCVDTAGWYQYAAGNPVFTMRYLTKRSVCITA